MSALNDKIVESMTDGKTSAEKPSFIVIGGGMQTGQAVLQKMMTDRNFIDQASTVVIAPGKFITMEGFDAHKNVQHPEKSPALVGAYQDIVRQTVAKAVENGCSVLLVDHAEDKDFILGLQKECAEAGYETLLVGVSSTPQSYFDYANYTEATQHRAADHPRGFQFLAAFSENFKSYIERFDAATLFKSRFSMNNGEPDIAIEKVAEFRRARVSGAVKKIYDPVAYGAFLDRAHLDRNATTPEDAVRGLSPSAQGGAETSDKNPGDSLRPSTLAEAFNSFSGKGFTAEASAQFKKIMAKRNGAAPKAP